MGRIAEPALVQRPVGPKRPVPREGPKALTEDDVPRAWGRGASTQTQPLGGRSMASTVEGSLAVS